MVHDEVSEATIKNKDLMTSRTLLKLHWSPKNVLPNEPADSYTVDIILHEYNYTTQEWVLTNIATGVSNTGYIEVIVPDFVFPKGYNTSVLSAIIEIRKSKLFSGSQNCFLSELLTYMLQGCCEAWGSFQSRESAEQILASLPPCPCTVSEIRKQKSVFEEETGFGAEFFRNFFHPGSSSCFRQSNS